MPEPISVPVRLLLCADWYGLRLGVHTWRKGEVNTAFGLRVCEGMDKCMVAKNKRCLLSLTVSFKLFFLS